MRVALGVLAAGAAALAMAGRRPSARHPPQPRYRGDQRASTAEHGGEPPRNDQPQGAATRERPGERQRTSDERHKRRECWYWGVTGSMSVVAGIATATAAWYAYGAFTQAQRQADTAQEALIAADRPWIKVTRPPRVRIDLAERVVWVRADLEVKNIGQSPAQHTYLSTALLPDTSVGEQNAEAENVCRKAAASGYPISERLVFPNDTRTLWRVAGLGIEAVRERRDRDLRWAAEMAKQTLGEDAEAADQLVSEGMAAPFRAAFTLVGCVTYAVSPRQVVGQTALIYSLYRACDLGPIGACSFDMDGPAAYEGEAVLVQEAPGGAFAR